MGPDENDGLGPWYFTLNNRRAWVLKRCREDGLLHNNLIKVRFRAAKSSNEKERYSLANCATDAKFIREQAPSMLMSKPTSKKSSDAQRINQEFEEKDELPVKLKRADTADSNTVHEKGVSAEGYSSEEEVPERPSTNRFYFGDDASDSSEDSDLS